MTRTVELRRLTVLWRRKSLFLKFPVQPEASQRFPESLYLHNERRIK